MISMRGRWRRAGVAGILLAVFASSDPAKAADDGVGQLTKEQEVRLQERLADIRGRLELSDEQSAELESVMRKSFGQRAAILERHGVAPGSDQRPSSSEARAIRRELKAVGEETEAEIDRILDDAQMAEYRKIREETQDEMRDRVRSRRRDTE